jgi:hypothetical protein
MSLAGIFFPAGIVARPGLLLLSQRTSLSAKSCLALCAPPLYRPMALSSFCIGVTVTVTVLSHAGIRRRGGPLRTGTQAGTGTVAGWHCGHPEWPSLAAAGEVGRLGTAGLPVPQCGLACGRRLLVVTLVLARCRCRCTAGVRATASGSGQLPVALRSELVH